MKTDVSNGYLTNNRQMANHLDIVDQTFQQSDEIFNQIESEVGIEIASTKRDEVVEALRPHVEYRANDLYQQQIVKGNNTEERVLEIVRRDFHNWICCHFWRLVDEAQQKSIANLVWDSIYNDVKKMAKYFAINNPKIARLTYDLSRWSSIEDITNELVGHACEYFLKTGIRSYSIDHEAADGTTKIGYSFWSFFEKYCVLSCFVKLKNAKQEIATTSLSHDSGIEEDGGSENQSMLLADCKRRFDREQHRTKLALVVETLDLAVRNGDLPHEKVEIYRQVVLEQKSATDVAAESGIANSTITKYKKQINEYLQLKLR